MCPFLKFYNYLLFSDGDIAGGINKIAEYFL